MDPAPDTPAPEPAPLENAHEPPGDHAEIRDAEVPARVPAETPAEEAVTESAPAESTEPEAADTPTDVPAEVVTEASTREESTPEESTPEEGEAKSGSDDGESAGSDAAQGDDVDAAQGAAAAAPRGDVDAAQGAAAAAPRDDAKKVAKKAAKKKRAKKKKRPPPPRPALRPLTPELKAEAATVSLARIVAASKSGKAAVHAAVEMFERGLSVPYIGRFKRHATRGMDERQLRSLQEALAERRELEEHRIGIRELLQKRGAMNETAAAALEKASNLHAMEDLAAPYLPVVAGRATMARGLGLQGLADAIRAAKDETPLSEMAKPFAQREDDPTALDEALGGARDILAEELGLDARLRGRLRDLFHKHAKLNVAARTQKREGKEAPSGGRHAALIGFSAKAMKLPPGKYLAIRRAEKERAIVMAIEPPEERVIPIVHSSAVPDSHPHAGFLRAAAEDGYRRILKPLLQNELREELKRKADRAAMEQYERTLRNLLLGPYAGPVRTLGLRPDVMNGHRWCAIDEQGLPTGAGQLPHEPTAGRDACLTELKQLLKTYEVRAIAVGTSGGRAEAMSLAREAAAAQDTAPIVTEVADGGTRTLEEMGPLELDGLPIVPPESRGALSLARRFQDPLTELIRINPKALALGPHLHEVHQGRLRAMLDHVLDSCVAHVGVDPASADLDLLQHVPGFTRKSAEAFLAFRAQAGPIGAKAELATIDDVGPEVAEQAVGFLRLASAADPRDRTQIHPAQYALVDKMAEQAGCDVPTLFSDEAARKKVRVNDLADDEIGPATLFALLEQIEAGGRDPRFRYTQPIPPPPEITLATLRPGLVLQGRVIRAAPFGVFLDVGLAVEALIPIPHIGEHPGTEPTTVAPVGAVINARVLEVDTQKKRLALSMRPGRPAPRGARPGGPPRGRGRSEGGGPGAPRGGRAPARAGAGAAGGQGRPAQGRPTQGGPGQNRPAQGRPGQGRPGQGRPGQGGGGPGRPGQGRPGQGGPRKKARFEKGGYGFGGKRERFDRNTPRTISLKPDEPEKTEKVDESKMSPEELMQFKLDQLKRKLERPDN